MNAVTKKRYILVAVIVGVVAAAVAGGIYSGLIPTASTPSQPNYFDTTWINLWDGNMSNQVYLPGCENRVCAGMGQTDRPLYQFDGDNYNYAVQPGAACNVFDINPNIVANPKSPYYGAFCDYQGSTRQGIRLVGSTQGDGYTGSRGLPIVVDLAKLNIPKGQYNIEFIASFNSQEVPQSETINFVSFGGAVGPNNQPQSVTAETTLWDPAEGPCARDNTTPTFEWFATDCAGDAWKNPDTEDTIGSRLKLQFNADDKLMVYGPAGSVLVGGVRVWGTPDNRRPVCENLEIVNAKAEYEIGEAVNFKTTASDPDGDTLTYIYNFGDGLEETAGVNTSHAYTEAGTYKVTVVVEDSRGWRNIVSPDYPCAVEVVVKAPAIKGSIGDLVWNDANHDGLQNDGANAGLGDVDVNLYYDSDNNGVYETWLGAKRTNAQGYYKFENLAMGKYSAVPDQDITNSPIAGWVRTAPASLPLYVTLTENQPNYLDADFGYYEPATPKTTISKSVDRQEVCPGEELTYTVNFALTDSDEVIATLQDFISDDVTYVAGSMHLAGTINGVNVNTDLTDENDSDAGMFYVYDLETEGPKQRIYIGWEPMAAGSSGTLTFRVKANTDSAPGTEIVNLSYFDTLRLDPVKAEVSSTVKDCQGVPQISIEKKVDKATACPGDELQYSVDFALDEEAETEATLQDFMPDEVTYVPGSMHLAGTVNGESVDQDLTDANDEDLGRAYVFTEAASKKQRLWLGWDAMDPGSSGTLTFRVTVNQGIAAETVMTNEAYFDTLTLDPVKGEAQTTLGSDCAEVALEFQKDVDKATAAPNDILTYSLHYKVSGSDLHNVYILDPIPDKTTYVNNSIIWCKQLGSVETGPISCTGLTDADDSDEGQLIAGNGGEAVRVDLGTLAVGSEGWVYFKVRINADVGTDGTEEIVNTATIYSDELDPISDDAVTIVVAPKPPTIDIVKEVDKDTAHAGDTLTYTLIYSIGGETTAENVVITDAVPTHTAYQAGSATRIETSAAVALTDADDSDEFDYNVTTADTLTWTLGDKEPGDSGRYQFKVTIDAGTPAGTTITNTGVIDADNLDPVSDDAVTEIVDAPLPVLTIEKLVDRATAEPGDTLNYTINYANTGEADAHDVIIYDYYPEEYLTVDTISDDGVDLGGEIQWDIGTLAAGASGTVTWSGTLISSFPTGTTEVIDTAVIDSSETEPVSSSVTTTVTVVEPGEPFIVVVKSAVDNNGDNVEPGDIITYTVVLTNKGDATAEEVEYQESLPAGLTDFAIISVPEGATNNSAAVGGENNTGFVSISGITLEPDESASISYTATVAADVADGTTIENLGTIVIGETTIPPRPRQGLVLGGAIAPPAPQVMGAATAPTAPATGVSPALILAIIIAAAVLVMLVIYRRRFGLASLKV